MASIAPDVRPVPVESRNFKPITLLFQLTPATPRHPLRAEHEVRLDRLNVAAGPQRGQECLRAARGRPQPAPLALADRRVFIGADLLLDLAHRRGRARSKTDKHFARSRLPPLDEL